MLDSILHVALVIGVFVLAVVVMGLLVMSGIYCWSEIGVFASRAKKWGMTSLGVLCFLLAFAALCTYIGICVHYGWVHG